MKRLDDAEDVMKSGRADFSCFSVVGNYVIMWGAVILS